MQHVHINIGLELLCCYGPVHSNNSHILALSCILGRLQPKKYRPVGWGGSGGSDEPPAPKRKSGGQRQMQTSPK